jgi:hypothetical protein
MVAEEKKSGGGGATPTAARAEYRNAATSKPNTAGDVRSRWDKPEKFKFHLLRGLHRCIANEG